jgi:hypothetical protein
MYLVVIAWLYVTLMMAVAEANSANGSLLGAIITFVLYGLLPVSLVVYLLATPLRRKALQKARDAASAPQDAQETLHELVSPLPLDPDAGGEPPAAPTGSGVAPMRKES